MAAGTESSAGISLEEFEGKRREIALRMLVKADEFLAWDLKFNNHISDLVGVLVEYAKRNLKILEPNSNLQDIIRDLNAKAAGGPGVSGGDFVGGSVWDDIWGVIKDLLVGEKDFIQKLIEKLLGL